jgi:hypothetical protein
MKKIIFTVIILFLILYLLKNSIFYQKIILNEDTNYKVYDDRGKKG